MIVAQKEKEQRRGVEIEMIAQIFEDFQQKLKWDMALDRLIKKLVLNDRPKFYRIGGLSEST